MLQLKHALAWQALCCACGSLEASHSIRTPACPSDKALGKPQVRVKRLISSMMEVTVTDSCARAEPAGPEALSRSSRRVYSSSSCVMVALSTSHPHALPLKSFAFSLHAHTPEQQYH